MKKPPDEDLEGLTPSPEMLDAGYMYLRDGQVWVTPKGLGFLRKLLDAPPGPPGAQ